MNEKIQVFFEKHPDNTEVHEALGVLFTNADDAQNYLGGVKGHGVKTHYRAEIENNNTGETAGQQPTGTTASEDGKNASTTPTTETGQQHQQTLFDYVGKPVNEIEAAIKEQDKLIAAKEKEVAEAIGFAKNKPKKELAEAEGRRSALVLALKETKLPQEP